MLTRLTVRRALVVLACVVLLACTRHGHGAEPPQTAPSVDLGRYVGQWYEIARLPNSFQSQCVSDVTATYKQRDDGRIDVVNRCRTATGEMDEAVGIARVEDASSRAKLKVRFAPAFLSFLPFVWGDYWVLALESDYRWAVVGTPDRGQLWILARNPVLSEQDYAAALGEARGRGFDVGPMIQTPHEAPAEAEPVASP